MKFQLIVSYYGPAYITGPVTKTAGALRIVHVCVCIPSVAVEPVLLECVVRLSGGPPGCGSVPASLGTSSHGLPGSSAAAAPAGLWKTGDTHTQRERERRGGGVYSSPSTY